MKNVIVAAAIALLAFEAHADAPVGSTVPRSGILDFDVLRKGKDFGRHRVLFDETPDGLQVTVDIDLDVKFGPIQAYKYRHDSTEVWRDGQLVALEAQTNRDGKRFQLEIDAVAEGVRVESNVVDKLLEGSWLPSSHWNRDVTQRTAMINTETGEAMDFTIEPIGRETIETRFGSIEADRYRLYDDIVLDLWYDTEGHWVKCAFETRGQTIEYVLRTPPSGDGVMRAAAP